jgi:hypothetical protein
MFIVQVTGKDEYDVILLSDLLPLSLSPCPVLNQGNSLQ